VVSVIAYVLADPNHAWVLVVAVVSTFWAALQLQASASISRRRFLLVVGLAVLVAALVGLRLVASRTTAGVFHVVPLGLSFFTLRLASYIVDVYRQKIPAERHFGFLALHTAIFAEVASGPIERAGALIPQLRHPRALRYEFFLSGVALLLWGLFKKVVVADRLHLFVSAVYDGSSMTDGAGYAIATLFFAFEIYCDFSGYSDMAIGVGRLFGLTFAENFERPYASESVPEFWTRWHMSFSFWLRDYVFLPIVFKFGRLLDSWELGPRTAEMLSYAGAAAVTMALCGLWHGTAAHFLAWGLVIAVFMVVSVATRKFRNRIAKRVLGKRFRELHAKSRVLTTFLLINVSWVFFRADSIREAIRILVVIPGGVASYVLSVSAAAVSPRLLSGVVAAPWRMGQSGMDLALALSGVGLVLVAEAVADAPAGRPLLNATPAWIRLPGLALLLASVVVFRAHGRSEFIYAGF
jgi:alginate O-acetyltransferase complex protein AlgI